MASNNVSSASVSSTGSIVRVSLVSFVLASNTGNTSPIHKEKFNVPLSEDHKDLLKFKKHLNNFTGLEDIARSKELGDNPEVTIARVQKAGSGVETSLRTQDAWQYEFDTLIQGNGMLQGTSNIVTM